MDNQIEDTLKEFFGSHGSPHLASNFRWQVMQRIRDERILRARMLAQLESLAIGVVAVFFTIGLFLGYQVYVSEPVTAVDVPMPAIVSTLALSGFWLLDTFVRSRLS